MPNHLHGIVILTGRGKACLAPTSNTFKATFGKPAAGSLSVTIGSLKSTVSRAWRIKQTEMTGPIWQVNYFEHVIRTEEKLNQIRRYIESNPARWIKDRYFPSIDGAKYN